jgi:hypothetical protein
VFFPVGLLTGVRLIGGCPASDQCGRALDRDAVGSVEAPGPSQERGGPHQGLVGQALRIRQAAVVVDRDVDPVPADVPTGDAGRP